MNAAFTLETNRALKIDCTLFLRVGFLTQLLNAAMLLCCQQMKVSNYREQRWQAKLLGDTGILS
jgi:hypothetical protein